MSALRKRDLIVDSLPEQVESSHLSVLIEEDVTPFSDSTNEQLNFLTHACGMIASGIAGLLLVQSAFSTADLSRIAGCSIFAGTMFGVYSCSTLSHGNFSPVWKHRFRTCDQISIFFFVAGSFTPFALVHLNSTFGMTLLAITWSLAATGALLKLFVTKREMVPVWFYVLQAGIQSLSLFKIVPLIPLLGTAWIIAGGLAYLSGIYFLMNDHKAHWYHAVWHLLVITGTACHFIVVNNYL